jgi:hypothetical protein
MVQDNQFHIGEKRGPQMRFTSLQLVVILIIDLIDWWLLQLIPRVRGHHLAARD